MQIENMLDFNAIRYQKNLGGVQTSLIVHMFDE